MALAILPGLDQKNKIITYVGAGCIVVMNLTTFLIFYIG